MWSDFFPLQYAPFLTYQNSKHFTKSSKPKSFGLGTLAHVESLLAVLAEHESVRYGTIQSSDSPKKPRLAQLKAMNLTIEETPFREYLNKSLDYALRKGFDY